MKRNRGRAARIGVTLGMAATVMVASPVESQAPAANASAWGGFSARTLQATNQNDQAVVRPTWGLGVLRNENGGYDVLVNNHAAPTGIWQQLGTTTGTYTEVPDAGAAGAGNPSAFEVLDKATSDSHGVRIADFDNDGDDDILIVSGGSGGAENRDDHLGNPNRLWINDGTNNFDLADLGADFELWKNRGRHSIPFDFNGDGVLDLIVGGVQDTPAPEEQRSRVLAGSLPGGSYDTTLVAGSTEMDVFGGYMNAGIVSNFGPGTPSQALVQGTAYINSRTLGRTNGATTATAGTAARLIPSDADYELPFRARDWIYGDFDGDLVPELVVLRVEPHHRPGDPDVGRPDLADHLTPLYYEVNSNGKPTSLKNGDGSLVPGTNIQDCASAAPGDFDNDGDLDLFLACGIHAEASTHYMLLNDGNGNFSVGTAALPAAQQEWSENTVSFDAEGDGDLDLYLAYGFETEMANDQFFTNQGATGNNWLELDLVGTADNASAIGAAVYVGSQNLGWQVRQVGHAYRKGTDALTMHVGLGADAAIAPVVVTWPNGTVEAFSLSGVNQRTSLVQGSGTAVPISTVTTPPVVGGVTPVPGATSFEKISAMSGLNDDHARVFRLYWAFFDRAPDKSGAEFWVGQVDRCLIDSAGSAVSRSNLLFEITRRFEDSAEFRAKYGANLTDLQFLEIVYQNVNGRTIDAGGRDFWLGQMTGGMSRAEVILRISYEPEFVGRTPLPSDGRTVTACSPTAPFRTFPA